MISEIVIVEDIEASIKDVGILPYANKVVQNMGGDYFFVDAEGPFNNKRQEGNGSWITYYHPDTLREIEGREDDESYWDWWQYKIIPLPRKIAYFIIEASRISKQFSDLGFPPNDHLGQETIEVYLPRGVEFMGQVTKRVTKIPAKIRPVVVEKI